MNRPINILLVDDSPADVRLTHESLKEGTIRNSLYVVNDGEQALDFLKRRGQYDSAIRPDIILLDLNLPRKSGHEILREIKEDETLRRIPVLVLTTSDDKHDIAKSYDLHANCYITKPPGLQGFGEMIHQIENFWLNTVRLPPD
jgi:CheY-like chemotaxis protein